MFINLIPIILLITIFLNSCSINNLLTDVKNENVEELKKVKNKCPESIIPNETSKIANNSYYPGLKVNIIKVFSSCKYKNLPEDNSLQLYIDFSVHLLAEKNYKVKKNNNNPMLYIAIVHNENILVKILAPIKKDSVIKVVKDKEILEVRNKFKYKHSNSIKDLKIYYGIQTKKSKYSQQNFK